jgi:hypothetical protein
MTMRARRSFTSLGAAALTAASLAAFDASALAPGRRVYVVAIHDSRLLTLCPVFGTNVSLLLGAVWAPATDGPISIDYKESRRELDRKSVV